MIIGIPKEIMHDEARVAATPETVGKFVKDGFEVLVECHAGDGALYHDEDYIREGAKMVADPQEIYDRAEMILKVKEPLMNEAKQKHEVDMMHAGQVLITFIHPASPVNHEMVRNLAAKGVTAITLDGIPRISRAQNMDALTSMSTCAGYKGILMAADMLTTFIPSMFTAVGQIKPAKVMVIGVGVAGLQALATAKRLGAVTYAADIRPMASEKPRFPQNWQSQKAAMRTVSPPTSSSRNRKPSRRLSRIWTSSSARPSSRVRSLPSSSQKRWSRA